MHIVRRSYSPPRKFASDKGCDSSRCDQFVCACACACACARVCVRACACISALGRLVSNARRVVAVFTAGH